MKPVHRPIQWMFLLISALAIVCLTSVVQAEQINIALGANPTESDPGWGGGTNPWDMVDGQRAYGNEWWHGLAFTGGVLPYIQPCGVRQATINFGTMKPFNRVMIWHHGIDHIPQVATLLYWNGSAWLPTGGSYIVRYDLATPPEDGAGSTPTEHIFPTVIGSKIRFQFDNCGLSMVPNQQVVHGWIYEFEVFYNRPPVCSGTASVSTLWPPEHQIVPVSILGVTDPDGDPVAITITGIYQDEPVNGLGDGDTAPDGWGVGSVQAQIRAERSGTGNGRVYAIGYTASDGIGGVCTGVVNVSVNKSQGKKGAAINNGTIFDATAP